MKRVLLAVTMTAAFVLGLAGVATAATTVTYTGQGWSPANDGSSAWILNDERSGQAGQGMANDGGTGQFANWNGTGQPYQTGDAYLVWVLTAKGATSATITLPDGKGPHNMYQVGGTFKFASPYWERDELVNVVRANYEGKAKNPQLVVSHGSAPAPTDEGAWCSPGYWANTLKKTPTNGWTTIGVDPATRMFNGNVSPAYYANDLTTDRLLTYVLDHPGDFGGNLGTAGPFNLTAFNATPAYLTDQIDGYRFDASLILQEKQGITTCPMDAFGNLK